MYIQHTQSFPNLMPSVRATQETELYATAAFARARKGNTRLPTAVFNYPDPCMTDSDLMYRATLFIRRN